MARAKILGIGGTFEGDAEEKNVKTVKVALKSQIKPDFEMITRAGAGVEWLARKPHELTKKEIFRNFEVKLVRDGSIIPISSDQFMSPINEFSGESKFQKNDKISIREKSLGISKIIDASQDISIRLSDGNEIKQGIKKESGTFFGVNFKEVKLRYWGNAGFDQHSDESGLTGIFTGQYADSPQEILVKENYNLVPTYRIISTDFIPENYENGAGYPDFAGMMNGWSMSKIKALFDGGQNFLIQWDDGTNIYDYLATEMPMNTRGDRSNKLIGTLDVTTIATGNKIYSSQRIVRLKDDAASGVVVSLMPSYEYQRAKIKTQEKFLFYAENHENLSGRETGKLAEAKILAKLFELGLPTPDVIITGIKYNTDDGVPTDVFKSICCLTINIGYDGMPVGGILLEIDGYADKYLSDKSFYKGSGQTEAPIVKGKYTDEAKLSINELRSGFALGFGMPPIMGIDETSNVATHAPEEISLKPNYPNPFNPKTVIEYSITKNAENVQLKIYDALGREIKTLLNQQQLAGDYRFEFDGTGLAGGTYFYRLNVDGKTIGSKKMTLLK